MRNSRMEAWGRQPGGSQDTWILVLKMAPGFSSLLEQSESPGGGRG